MSRYWRLLIVVAAFLQFLVSVGPSYNYSVFLIPLQTEFKTSAVSTGWVGSLASAMLCGLSPLTAALGWKIGNGRVVCFGVILTAAGYLATSFISSLAPAYLTYGMITGLGKCFMFCGSTSVLVEWYQGRGDTCRVTGGTVIGSSVGVMVFGPVLNSLTASYGWRNTFRILSGITLAVGLLTALPFLKPAEKEPTSDQGDSSGKKVPEESSKCDQGRGASGVLSSGSDSASCVPRRGGSLKSFCEKVLNIEVWLWVSSITTAQLGWTFAIINFSSFMDGIGLATQEVSIALTVFGAAEVGGKLAFAVFGDRLPCLKLYVAVASSGGGALVSGFLTLCSAFWSIVVLSVVWGFCRGVLYGLTYVAAAELFTNYSPRTIVAISVLGYGTGVLIGSPLTGAFYDLTGDYTLSLFVVVASFVTSVLCALSIPLKRALVSRVPCCRRPVDDVNNNYQGNSTKVPPVEDIKHRSVGTYNPAYEMEI
ncbi:monocarboxylate transporter 13-like [Acanthaster planci]|uniref:Monocarboxylate transporter 13-like n=1 Tax=Acanthaster planci TaxID=133434 RepID=A0A8B7Y6V9_ACAPL|nr:monocarboxylate transporter 13-like [Acanthaster planci]